MKNFESFIAQYERQVTAGSIGKVVTEHVDESGRPHTRTLYVPTRSLIDMADEQERALAELSQSPVADIYHQI